MPPDGSAFSNVLMPAARRSRTKPIHHSVQNDFIFTMRGPRRDSEEFQVKAKAKPSREAGIVCAVAIGKVAEQCHPLLDVVTDIIKGDIPRIACDRQDLISDVGPDVRRVAQAAALVDVLLAYYERPARDASLGRAKLVQTLAGWAGADGRSVGPPIDALRI